MREITFQQALDEAVAEEMRRDPRVITMGTDFTGNPVKEFGPARVRFTPISEAVLTGVVDPLDNLEHTLALASHARERGWRVRVNSQGFANQTAGRDVTKELNGLVDEIDVTLFGVNSRQHDELAYPLVGNDGWEQIRDFVRSSVGSGIETVCEFVATPGFEPEPCRQFARDLGARYDIRMYRS